jgi:hypothetical protein
MWKTAAALCVAMMMVACATQAQQQGQQMKATLDKAGHDFEVCADAVDQDPAVAPILEKMPKDLRNATLRQQMDDTRATEAQIAALYIRHDKMTVCRDHGIQTVTSVSPALASILVDEYTKKDKQLIALIQKKLTWGEYVMGERDINAAATAAIAAEDQKIISSLQQSHDAEMARRDAAYNAYMQYQQTQQLISTLGSNSGGSTTNAPVNCRTVLIGTTARTQCY